MQVKDLIKSLHNFDPEAEVMMLVGKDDRDNPLYKHVSRGILTGTYNEDDADQPVKLDSNTEHHEGLPALIFQAIDN